MQNILPYLVCPLLWKDKLREGSIPQDGCRVNWAVENKGQFYSLGERQSVKLKQGK